MFSVLAEATPHSALQIFNMDLYGDSPGGSSEVDLLDEFTLAAALDGLGDPPAPAAPSAPAAPVGGLLSSPMSVMSVIDMDISEK